MYNLPSCLGMVCEFGILRQVCFLTFEFLNQSNVGISEKLCQIRSSYLSQESIYYELFEFFILKTTLEHIKIYSKTFSA